MDFTHGAVYDSYPRNPPPLRVALIVAIVVVVLAIHGAAEACGDGRAVCTEVAKDARRLVHHGRAGRVEAVVVHSEGVLHGRQSTGSGVFVFNGPAHGERRCFCGQAAGFVEGSGAGV